MKNHRLHRFKLQITQIILLSIFYFLLSTQIGCESFRKKFIRKPKHEPAKEEMVVVPKDYSKQQIPADQAYKQYYVYWKAWHNELVSFLKDGESKKKIVSCFEQSMLNLEQMKALLSNEEKIGLLESYINKITSLKDQVEDKNIAMISMSSLRSQSEQLLRNIQRDFSFSKVKPDLKK